MKKIRVYFNLHKKMLSVQEKVNGSWKVVDYVEQIWLGDATFKVSEAGRQRVLKQKRKNVHAFVQGIVNNIITIASDRKICYNPYKAGHFFYCSNGREIKKAVAVRVGLDGVYIS